MRTFLSAVMLLAIVGIKAQNNLVVFSENGEKFFLIINGVKQNMEAQTNVKVTDLIQPNYKAKIVFEDKAKGVVDQNIYFMDGGEPVKNHEFVFSVGIKKKGGYKARPVSAVAIGPQTKADPEQTVVHYTATEPTPSNNNVVNNESTNVHVANDGTSMSNNVQVDQTVTQTQSSSGENVNVGINMNGMGVNISVNDNMGNGNMSTTTSQTVTTTKSSGGTTVTKSSTSATSNGNTTKTSSETTTTTKGSFKDGYETGTKVSAAKGCARPMNSSEFNAAKESIDSKGMDDSKLKVAKQVLDNNCMTSDQVKEVIGLFSFEQSKLDFAKHAYGKTTDKNNYYKINDAFSFESSITDLDNYIKSSGSSTK